MPIFPTAESLTTLKTGKWVNSFTSMNITEVVWKMSSKWLKNDFRLAWNWTVIKWGFKLQKSDTKMANGIKMAQKWPNFSLWNLKTGKWVNFSLQWIEDYFLTALWKSHPQKIMCISFQRAFNLVWLCVQRSDQILHRKGLKIHGVQMVKNGLKNSFLIGWI